VITADGSACLVRSAVALPAGQRPGRVDIDTNFSSGKFLVSSGPSGYVEIVLNGRHIADANTRMVVNQGNGVLSFDVINTLPANSPAQAIAYTCYDRNMAQAICQAAQIPQ
jgi:hypothetical protein